MATRRRFLHKLHCGNWQHESKTPTRLRTQTKENTNKNQIFSKYSTKSELIFEFVSTSSNDRSIILVFHKRSPRSHRTCPRVSEGSGAEGGLCISRGWVNHMVSQRIGQHIFQVYLLFRGDKSATALFGRLQNQQRARLGHRCTRHARHACQPRHATHITRHV